MTKELTQEEKDVAKAQEAVVDFRRRWEMEKKIEYDLRIKEVEGKRDFAVWQAHKKGVSKAAIARAMGTTARVRVYEILKNSPDFSAFSNPPVARMDGDTLILTFKDTPGVTEDLLTGEFEFTRDGRFWDPVEMGPETTKITKLLDSDESNPVKDAVERATKEGKS